MGAHSMTYHNLLKTITAALGINVMYANTSTSRYQ